MAKSDEINKAIGAHGMWKARLRNAIDSGKSEWSVAQVKVDNQCEFGKWLHSLPEGERKTDNWKNIRDLHAKFHNEAAKILDNALQGRKDGANKGLEPTGEFAQTSSALTGAMVKWLKAS